MLGAEPPPLVNGDIAPLGDADQRVMRLEILLRGEIGLVGGDNRKIEIVGEAEQSGLDAALLRQAVALQLDVEPVAEDRLQRFEPVAGKLGVAFGEREVDHPFRSAGQSDQAFGVGGKIGDRGDHLARLGRREIGVGREPHQIGVARLVLGEERDAAIGAGAAELGPWRWLLLGGEGERQSEPDDRLDARLGEAFGEFERAEQIVGISQRQRRSAIGARQRGELRDGQRAFEQRIGRVHPKMHEGLALPSHSLHSSKSHRRWIRHKR